MANFNDGLWIGLILTSAVSFGACSATDKGNTVPSGGSNGSGASSAGGGSAFGGSGPQGGFGGTINPAGGNGGNPAGGAGGTGNQPSFIDDCPGALDPALAQALQAGGAPDPSMKWLYPYDKTVFPRGLIAPVLQWTPAGNAPPEAVFVHLKSNNFEYKGCFGPTNPARLPLPQNVWDAASSQASGVQDPINVELTTAAGGKVSGPIKELWAIAAATLKGAIYYNTYGSPQVANNGAVMRIIPGQAQPQPFLTETGVAPLGPCRSCHSLSANGQSLVTARHAYPAGPYESFAYDIKANPNPNPPPISPATLDAAGFAAVFPDGSRFMTNGSPNTTIQFPFPNGPGNVVGMEGPRTSRLFSINGAPITANGWNVQFAKMPMFSPDGRHIVFNHHEAGNGHRLAVMDFDPGSNSFANLATIYENPTLFPGWPFFTPDSKGVIFALGNADDFVGSHPARPIVARSDLFYTDLATKQTVPLGQAGGFNGATPYIPYPGRDEHYEFFPTVSPVAAGGYFWLFFTSRRNYGNVTVGPPDLPGSKKIWVSAIDINAPPGSDPSHPAFFLPGQEPDSGNVRAFAALEPCKADGDACNSGVQCCCGACTATGQCGCPQGCSKVDEKCTTTADCCDPGVECINGFCAFVVPK